MTHSSQTDCDVNIYFIIPNGCKSPESCNQDMLNAFSKCTECQFDIEWIAEKKCKKLQPTKKDIFIIQAFEGEIFEYLQNFKCSILGPRCLLSCFVNEEPIPEGISPVFTTPMRDLVVSASGLTPESKNEIQRMVEYMGGVFTKQLRNSVTHLVTNCVISAKYEKAAELKIPIYTEKWVQTVWEVNLKMDVKATDSSFDKYKAPVFFNLVITSTNIHKTEKDTIQKLINGNGGVFMGPLDGSKVKVVLAPENTALSEKLKFARSNNIACVNVRWVYESIKAGYALGFTDFLIKSTKATSTPERTIGSSSFDLSAVSVIPAEMQQNNCVEESLMTTVTASSFSSVSTVGSNNDIYTKICDRLLLKDAKAAGTFLEGCNIYLAGFSAKYKDKLNKILNVGGATRFDDLSDALTHVVIGDEAKAANDLKLIKEKGLHPYILNLKWLEESLKHKRPAAEEYFIIQAKNTIEPPSPLSKRNLQMLQKPKKVPTKPVFDNEDDQSIYSRKQDSDLVQQYLQNPTERENRSILEHDEFQRLTLAGKDHETSKQDIVKKKLSSNNLRDETAMKIAQKKDLIDNTTMIDSQGTDTEKNIFAELTFILTGFDEEKANVEENILEWGGRIVTESFSGIPDYGVVPIYGTSFKRTVNEIVTDLFIFDCVNQEKILEPMYFHRPICIKKGINPLSEFVVTLSTYSGEERKYLSTLAELLGARCQDTFVRKTNVERNQYASTHLICPIPEGSKYNAAVKWKLPAVTADWLIQCYKQCKLVNETNFLVGETMAPDRTMNESIIDPALRTSTESREKNMGPPTTSRNILTPKRHLPQIQNRDSGNTDSLLINKRLSQIMTETPRSPFHVSTPDTPYGQLIKPNPSPNTRKAWVEWIDNFPDIKTEEPPTRKRRLSTPLSELKKQLWEKMKIPIQNKESSDEATPSTSTQEKYLESSSDNLSTNVPINRKLDFNEQEDSPLKNSQIQLQLAQLENALKRTSSISDTRKSVSNEGPNRYPTESADHMQICMSKDTQPDTVGWEDPRHRIPSEQANEGENDVFDHCENIENELQKDIQSEPVLKKKIFMLSGIKDREAYEKAIINLGGEVSIEANFDNTATHLLCIRPTRNEKMLSSIAAGKWILHSSYLRDSQLQEKFLNEEEYEWGNPKSKNKIPELEDEMEKGLAAAAYKWRIKLTEERRGAFHNMVALLITSSDKYDQLKRLIQAGGGEVIQARPPYDASPSGKKITHCFVHIKQFQQPVDWAMLANKGIMCFLPQYLSYILTSETPTSPRECVHPEFKKYLALLPR